MTSLSLLSDFALSLRRESNIEGSSVCSPLSIGLVLALLHAGANGATKKQIAHALAKGASEDEVQKMFELATSFSSAVSSKSHSDISIEPLYLETIKKNYDAVAQIIDFSDASEAAKTINSFVETTTKGKISGLMSADDFAPDTTAIVVNAIYFNGDWLNKFERERTSKMNFFAGKAATRKVDMMHQTETFMYTETNEVQVLSMKYVDESYAYDVFLPKENFAGGLDAFLAGLTGTKMQTLLKSMKSSLVEVSLPKAKIETSQNLKPTLIKLGIKDVFYSDADLSGISKNDAKPLFVGHIATKAFIEVDERGTTAAAATVSQDACWFGSDKPRVFNANRPYFFVLSKGGASLFTGVYR